MNTIGRLGKITLIFDRNIYSNLLTEFQPQVIASEAEYDHALEAVEKLMNCDSTARLTVRTPEQTAIMKLLVTLVEYPEFFRKAFPVKCIRLEQIIYNATCHVVSFELCDYQKTFGNRPT
ncbi:MAG: hypothetical protein H0X31_21375 [Nostocaceae cyanobacterium]|nr:hypothetical protein [Nostocaceae cyanobacterium]